MIAMLLLAVLLSSQPDEVEIPTLKAPSLPATPSQAMLVAAIRSAVILPPTAPPQWLFQPAPLAPTNTFKLSWQPSSDPDVVGYAVQSTPDLNQYFYTITNVTTTNIVVKGHLWCEFYRVLSINSDGLNSAGYYSK